MRSAGGLLSSWALAGGVALAIAVLPSVSAAIWPFSSEEEPELRERAAELLIRAISIRSVNPPGTEAELAALYVKTLRDAGLEARTIPTPEASRSQQDATAGSTRAAAWGRLPGTGGAPPIVLLSHLDVVDAEPGEWRSQPFEGRVDEGYVVGRGALDAKGVSVIHLLSLLELKRRDIRLERDVIFLATPDEESGGQLGAGYLVREHPELLHGADLLLTEGGSVHLEDGKAPIWGVTIVEKSPCWLRITSTGTPGHTSQPTPDAAVHRLIAALDAIRRVQTPIRVLPEVQRMFRTLAPAAAKLDRPFYRDLEDSLRNEPTFRRRFLANPGTAALVRDTIAITVLKGAPQTNVALRQAFAEIDGRLLPGRSCSDFARELGGVVGDPAVSIERILSFSSQTSATDTPLFRAIERVASKRDPDAIVVPRMIAGFTDAHWFRDLGIVSYGFVPRRLSAADTRGIHGPNERVSIENLEVGTQVLVDILLELAAP